jgi:mRNA interferase HigB
MRIISKAALVDFYQEYPDAKEKLEAWYRTCKSCNAKNFSELKQTFNTADYVPRQFTVFNAGGNEYRIVTAIHYDKQLVYIREVLTHVQYDKWTKQNRGK